MDHGATISTPLPLAIFALSYGFRFGRVRLDLGEALLNIIAMDDSVFVRRIVTLLAPFIVPSQKCCPQPHKK